MEPYTQFIVTKDSATFKGPAGTKTIKLGTIKIDPIVPNHVDFTLYGDNETVVSFGPDTLRGGYQAILREEGKRESYIPITSKLIIDVKAALTGKTTLAEGETIEVGTVTRGADEERLTLTQIEQMPKDTNFARMQSRWVTDKDTRSAFKKLYTSRPKPREVVERVPLGRFVGSKTEGTNYNGVTIINFERGVVRYDGHETTSPTDVFVEPSGGRRSRLNVQRRRTQRNGRHRVGRKARKLATRRR